MALPQPSPVNIPTVFGKLSSYVTSCGAQCRACLDTLEDTGSIDGLDARLRFHFVKFTTDGEPKFRTLARVLVLHLVRYCLSSRTRQEIEAKMAELDGISDDTQLFLLARDYFRKIDTSGECGELLLFFLLETLFQAPQVVAKMELKTNPADEVKRSDGIHVGWDAENGQCILYLGESKLYASPSDAISNAALSIAKLHGMHEREEELKLLTSHFKYLDDNLKDAVLKWVSDDTPDTSYRIVQACLIGYDWTHYKHIADDRKSFVKDFVETYKTEITRHVELVRTHFAESTVRHLKFEFMFLPFDSVQSFRDAFYEILTGKSS